MNITYLTYLITFKLAIIISGIVSILLGYLLFTKGIGSVKEKGTTLEADMLKRRFLLRNAAPGTLFALFGIVLISIMLYTSSPEVTIKTLKEIESISGEGRAGILSKKEKAATEVYLRSTEMSKIDNTFQEYNENLISAEEAIYKIKKVLDAIHE